MGQQTSGTTYYVGNPTRHNAKDDQWHGTHEKPFETAAYAAAQLDGIGGFIVLMDGIHWNNGYKNGDQWKVGQHSISLENVHGTAENYITLKGESSYGNTMTSDAESVIHVKDCSYIIVENLNLVGYTDSIDYDQAYMARFDYKIAGDDQDVIYKRADPTLSDEEVAALVLEDISDQGIIRPPYYNTNGVVFINSAHILVKKVSISHCPGIGLLFEGCDYVEAFGNVVHDNSRRSAAGDHGMVIKHTKNNPLGLLEDEGATDMDEYRMIFSTNTVHSNYNEIYSWKESDTFINPKILEGKGMTLQNSNSNSGFEYGRVIFYNNLAIYNGYSGIHVNNGARVDIYHNTIVNNTLTFAGEQHGISLATCPGCTIKNNIAYNLMPVGKAIHTTSESLSADGQEIEHNLIIGAVADIVEQSSYYNVFSETDTTAFEGAGSYYINSGSAAENIGVADGATRCPFDRAFQPRSSPPDAGAYEVVVDSEDMGAGAPAPTPTPLPSPTPTPTPTTPTPTPTPTGTSVDDDSGSGSGTSVDDDSGSGTEEVVMEA